MRKFVRVGTFLFLWLKPKVILENYGVFCSLRGSKRLTLPSQPKHCYVFKTFEPRTSGVTYIECQAYDQLSTEAVYNIPSVHGVIQIS